MDLPDKTQPAQPKKVIKKIADGQVQKRPATRRFADYMFADSPKEIAQKVGRDVIVPRLKAGVEEAFNNFLSGMLWGNGGNRPMSMIQGTVLRGGNASYALNSGQVSPLTPQVSQPAPGGYADVVLPTQERAEDVLAYMYDLLNQYSQVAVGDLYEAAGLTPEPHHNAIGWTTFDGTRVTKQRNGYCLELPRPKRII